MSSSIRKKLTGTRKSTKDRLDYAYDGRKRPLDIGELGLGGFLSLTLLLKLPMRLSGLEIGNLALQLLGPEPLAFSNGTLCLAIWPALASCPYAVSGSGLGSESKPRPGPHFTHR